ESADEPEAKIAPFSVFAVEAFHHEHVVVRDGFEARIANRDAATTRQLKGRVLDSLKVASIAFFRKFAEPQAIAVFDGGLGPRADPRRRALHRAQRRECPCAW